MMWGKLLLAAGMLVPAFAQNCTFTISPTSIPDVPAGGGALKSVSVTAAGTNCQWTAVSNVPWMRVTFGQSGSGNGSFGPAVDPNNGPSRTGTITAAGQTLTVMQAGCTFAFSPSSATYPFPGGGGSFTVQPTPSSCTWIGATTSNWINISSASGGPGSGTLSYSVVANPTPSVRIGNITVGAQTFAITEAAAPCTTSLSPGTATVAASGATGFFRVTVTPAGCTWTATSASSFVTVTAGATGANSGNVDYSVAANTGSQRSGAIRVNDQSFNITQSAPACTYTAIPDQTNFGVQGGPSAVALATSAGCPWTAASNAAFITITGATSGTGPTRVGFTVAANAGAARSGTLAIGGQTVMLSQEAATTPPPTGPQLDTVKNSASNSAGAISAGEILTLSGSRLGPDAMAPMQSTDDGLAATTLLAGTRVLFDGVAAPMLSSRASQVMIVAPYGLADKISTRVQVEYQGTLSNAMTLDVAPSTPSIFSIDNSGKGQGVVLNADFSVNGPGNPAAAGSTVQIFATGAGQMAPPCVDGHYVTTPPPVVNVPVIVRIGSLNAEWQFAGGAPGLVAGLVMITAVVPNDVQTGDAVPVAVQFGDRSSQDGITIAIVPAP